MYKDNKILALIPARGGSKGIPNKNIIDLCGKPLIQYSIDTALSCAYIDDVVVSTDSQNIADIAIAAGAQVPFLRPACLATDTAKTIDCMLYTIQELSSQGKNYDYVILLQPTQPIRTPQQLEEALTLLIDNNQSSLVSVCPVEEHPILMRTIDKQGHLNSLLKINSTVRRQDFPAVYKVNGSIYINKIDEHFNKDTSLNDNILPYIMDRSFSIDIDSLSDLKKAEKIIQKGFESV